MKLSVEQIPYENEEEVIVRCYNTQEKWVEAIRAVTAGEVSVSAFVEEKVYRLKLSDVCIVYANQTGSTGRAHIIWRFRIYGTAVCWIYASPRMDVGILRVYELLWACKSVSIRVVLRVAVKKGVVRFAAL